jgi:hypothetical protein
MAEASSQLQQMRSNVFYLDLDARTVLSRDGARIVPT